MPTKKEKKAKVKTGVQQWADESVNICTGCSNACLYCYGRDQMLNRYHKIPNGLDWENEKVRPADVAKTRTKINGVIMFPTTHDITLGNLEACTSVLKKLLKAGNQVLIVTKPRRECMKALFTDLVKWKDQIEFRFSIGTLMEKVRKFWEPNAPSLAERFDCLGEAKYCGYKLSISCEPLLSPWSAAFLVHTLDYTFKPDTIWIGTMNNVVRRCQWILPPDHPKIVELMKWQTPAKMLEIYEKLKDNPKILWKDSYQKVIDAACEKDKGNAKKI